MPRSMCSCSAGPRAFWTAMRTSLAFSRCPSGRARVKAWRCCASYGALTILRSQRRAATGRHCSLGLRGGRAPGLSMAAGPGGALGDGAGAINKLKRVGLGHPVPVVSGLHRVPEVLRLADALGVPRIAEVVLPKARPMQRPDRPYAVIHAAPMFRYKRWTAEGWRRLAAGLASRGLAIVATTGPSAD